MLSRLGSGSRKAGLGLFCGAALLLTACGGAAPPSVASPATPPAAAKAYKPAAPKISITVSTDPEADLIARAEQLKVKPFPTSPLRPQVDPVSFRIADLPVSTVPDSMQKLPAPNVAALPGDEAPELTSEEMASPSYGYGYPQQERTVKIGLKGAPFGHIRVGSWFGWTGSANGSNGGVFVTCSKVAQTAAASARYGHGVWPPVAWARWDTVTFSNDGQTADYGVNEGWFDRLGCKAKVSWRAAAKAKQMLPGGMLYGFRECGKTCAEREVLTLIFPISRGVVATSVGGTVQQDVGAFTRVTIPIRRGGGGSVMAQISGYDLRTWRAALATARGEAPAATSSSQADYMDRMVIGVEVSQGVDDAEPVAIAYVDGLDRSRSAARLGLLDSAAPSSVSLSPVVSASALLDDCRCQPNDSLCGCL
jgi:hypothetical protein